LGAAEEASRLFPNGLSSLELEIGSGAEGRVSLRLSGANVESAASASADATILLEGDVEALFNAEGHHIVALITQEDLNQHFPATMRKVQKILDDGGRDLLSAATFPDDIRQSHPETKPFHFIDIPFEDGGPVNPPLPPAPHVISKIAEFFKVVKNGANAQQKVDALSWLIHLVGDIHQPLHCIEHISALHKAGDRGGNSFLLKGKPNNLHSLWDSSVSFTQHEGKELALDIIREHPRTALATDLKVTDVEKWARASFDLAKKFAYAPLHENPASPPKPSATYMKNAEKTGRRQAALAGYRLSNRLREILG